jgi:hypothetical protein
MKLTTLSSSGDEIESGGAIFSLPPYMFMEWCLSNYAQGNFISALQSADHERSSYYSNSLYEQDEFNRENVVKETEFAVNLSSVII